MKRKVILIVDDSVVVADRLLGMLLTMEYIDSVFHADTYSRALHFLGEKNPMVVILDINLPDGNGIDLLRFIRIHHDASIVIMLSNQGDPYYRTLCKKLGAHYFVDKSQEFEQIPSIISSI